MVLTYENQSFAAFITTRGIFIYFVIVMYWLSNLVEKYVAVVRCSKIPTYINYPPPVKIHLPLFIKDLKITLKVVLRQKSSHFIAGVYNWIFKIDASSDILVS